MPGDQRISSAWNTVATQSGSAVSAVNASYNGQLAPGGSTAFGFTATMTGSTAAVPSAFQLNGSACSAT